MEEKIKLIWDFKGPNALQTAIHHETHLKEFASAESLILQITGNEQISDMHCIAFLVVYKNNMIAVRDALKPHRGQLYNK